MDQSGSMCEYLANILGGKGHMEDGVCTVMRDRKDIRATIAGRPFHSVSHMFDFEEPDAEGKALITGEMVFLETEVPRAVSMLTALGVIVSAIHTHWLYDNPKLIYLHIEATMNPTAFATGVARILNT